MRSLFCLCVVAIYSCIALAKEATEQQLEEYRRDFAEFDLNNDGQIDVMELRFQIGNDLDQSHFRRLVEEIDKDESGTVTMQEYVNYALTL